MTDLTVDLDHLTSLAARLGALANRLDDAAAAFDASVPGALGVERLDRAWSGFRQRRRDGGRRLGADVGRAGDGLARTRDAYAAAEAAIERGLRP